MDTLSQLLAELRVASALHCRIAVGAGSGVAYPSLGAAGFHVLLAGAAVLELADGERRALAPGDLVILPHGDAHRLLAAPLPPSGGRAAAVPSIDAVVARAADGVATVGDGAEAARWLCGAFRFATAADHPLLSALPRVLHVPAVAGGEASGADGGGAGGRAELPWLRAHLDMVACEARSGRPGAEVVIARLTEVLFVQAIRAELAELPPDARGWLGALRDPELARAVGAIHRHPERPWTVATLAREAGMSRSRFAERFAAVLGRPPLAYLAAWRMHRGRALLREGALRVGEVARRVGYGSEAAFSTAFRRAAGVAPATYRRATGEATVGRPR